MNYKYKSKMEWEEIICYIAIIIVTLFAIISNTISPINQPNQYNTQLYELFSSDWWKSMLGVFIFDVFVFCCIYLMSANRRNYTKWRKKIIENGIKIDGEVNEIRFVSPNIYRLKVSYYSHVYNKENIFEIPEVYIKNLNTDRKIICDVYELGSMEERHDYDADLFTIEDNSISDDPFAIEDNSISISANPLKLLVTVHKKYTDKNFGNVHAENYRYRDEEN